ncbi:DUF2059 domain-containing protein [Pseudaestuariivita atlantica]|uniref:Ribosomal protein L21 n=1 Tax=Pseudaestuariivita atlantica TaxID=1317121 RepID=A0A0L1JU09_9RHOB|nr:DUF2059 domain-containing protein [Pseudaestuariivita atlantica]KNG95246.1 ribosomal protein L21 [Pseudaestuariivita atlantica]
MIRATFAALSLAVVPGLAWSEPSLPDRLLDAMGVDGIVAIMRDEGLAYGDELAAQMVPGGPDESWRAAVARIYDTDRMTQTVRVNFAEAIDGTDITPLIDFFESPGGRQLISLELSARAAMMDEAVEEAAKDAFHAAEENPDDRFRQITEFVEVNDLVDSNVVGALNSNIVFYQGLVDGGALDLGDEDILRDVWEQEEETRSDTREWVYGFLLLAYKPVEDDVLQDYIDLSATKAGMALNRALFAGFDAMYSDISYALGRAIAREMQVQDL